MRRLTGGCARPLPCASVSGPADENFVTESVGIESHAEPLSSALP